MTGMLAIGKLYRISYASEQINRRAGMDLQLKRRVALVTGGSQGIATALGPLSPGAFSG